MKIDFSFYIAIILSLISGQIDIYLTYLIALTIHECGHLIIASIFKWEIFELKISAIGGFLTFKDDLTKPAWESFCVASGGIIFNIIFGLILLLLDGPATLIYTQFAIAIFNLLPITPLDGSRLIQAFLRGVLDYKMVLKVIRIANIIFLIIFILTIAILGLEQYFIVAGILAILVFKYHKMVPYLYQRYRIQNNETIDTIS